MFDPASLLELQTYDPQNPLVGYVYLIILAMIIRILFIIIPLRDIYQRLTNQGLKDLFLEVIKEARVEKDIRGFIIREIVLLFVPITAVFILHWFLLGEPNTVAWNHLQIAGAVLVGGAWITYDIYESYQTRQSLKPFGVSSIEPKYVFGIIPYWIKIGKKETLATEPSLMKAAWGSRKTLMKMSKWSVEYIDSEDVIDSSEPRDPILTKSDEGKYGIDKKALLEGTRDAAIKGLIMAKNTQQKVKELIRDASGNIVDWSDQEIQNQVQSVTNSWSRMKSFMYSLVMIFGPLYFIYGVLPILG
jgi:hypothetical protein